MNYYYWAEAKTEHIKKLNSSLLHLLFTKDAMFCNSKSDPF